MNNSIENTTLLDNKYIDVMIKNVQEAEFKLNDFDFDLPESFIATTPRPQRSSARLLRVEKSTGTMTHSTFQSIDQFFKAGDLLIFNDTRIIPSHLIAQSTSGNSVDVFVERVLTTQKMFARIFKSALDVGDILTIANEPLEIVDHHDDFYELHLKNAETSLWDIIHFHGELAFPTYFGRDATSQDIEFFQNFYAKKDGSVSAPSAGFHFDETMFEKLKTKGVNMGFVTLHVGSGTSAPVHEDDISKHKMHTEWLEVSPEICELIKETKSRGNRVIAIGTTSLRALETASQGGEINPFRGYTDIFIRPGYEFKCVDGLFTNFHLPRSTLMMLISALGGYHAICEAYKSAIVENYRFLAYGDAMLID